MRRRQVRRGESDPRDFIPCLADICYMPSPFTLFLHSGTTFIGKVKRDDDALLESASVMGPILGTFLSHGGRCFRLPTATYPIGYDTLKG